MDAIKTEEITARKRRRWQEKKREKKKRENRENKDWHKRCTDLELLVVWRGLHSRHPRSVSQIESRVSLRRRT
eukprot:565940-Rhodomonas_salina.3